MRRKPGPASEASVRAVERLAKLAGASNLTRSGTIPGTIAYMAPEQALGHKLDQRADLFSLGSVLYQMITGRPPFRARNTLAVLKRVVEHSPRPIPEIIPEIPENVHELNGIDARQAGKGVPHAK